MAEDAEDKTEPATERRRQEAYDSGRFPKSHDLSSAVLLMVGLIIIHWTGKEIITQLAAMMRGLLGTGYWGDQHELVDNSLRLAVKPMIAILWPIFLTMLLAAIAINVFQVGLRFTGKPLTPNLAKLNPLAGLGRLFKGQNRMQLAMNIIKMIVVLVVAFLQFKRDMPRIIGLMDVSFPENMQIGFAMVYDMGLRMGAALLVLAIIDWLYQKWKFERDIRMSKQEVKDETKMMEGDMETKGRRRQLARKMMMQRIQSDVPRADVVVTNPTELAIALKYDPKTMSAPRVVAKGAGYLAMTIRQVAVQHGVAIVERKPLAQTLYKTVEVGQEVPPHMYQAIAEILAYVYELSGKKPQPRRREPETVNV